MAARSLPAQELSVREGFVFFLGGFSFGVPFRVKEFRESGGFTGFWGLEGLRGWVSGSSEAVWPV